MGFGSAQGNIGAEVRDGVTNAIRTIDYQHHEIHAGSAFTVSKVITVPAGLKAWLLITTPNSDKWAHMTFSVTCDAAYTSTFYEGPDYAGGTGVLEVNHDRNSLTAATTTVTHTPSENSAAGGEGTALWTFQGGASHPASTQVSSGARGEFILKQNTLYLLEIVATENDIAYFQLDWYEHTNI